MPATRWYISRRSSRRHLLEVMDIEDAHKLGIIPTASVMRHFLSFFPPTAAPALETRMATVDDPNEKISYLRSCVIGALVTACADAFAANEDAILAGRFDGSLLHHIHSSKKRLWKHATICRGSASTAPPMWLTSSSPATVS